MPTRLIVSGGERLPEVAEKPSAITEKIDVAVRNQQAFIVVTRAEGGGELAVRVADLVRMIEAPSPEQ